MSMDFKKIYSTYMSIIGVGGQLLFFSQAYKIFTTQHAQDVSLFGFTIALVSVTSWLIYGIILKDFPLILSNAVACIGATAVLVGIFMYG